MEKIIKKYTDYLSEKTQELIPSKSTQYQSPSVLKKIQQTSIKKSFETKKDKNFKINTVKQLNFPVELTESLNKFDEKIKKIEKNGKDIGVKEKIEIFDLMEKKIELLMKPNIPTFGLEIDLLRQINKAHFELSKLFKVKAIAGDLDAIKALKPFFSDLTLSFFDKILDQGNIEVFEFIIKNFEICSIFFNYCNFSFSDSKDIFFSVLLKVMLKNDDIAMFRMLLKNGADPDCTYHFHENLFSFAISLDKYEYAKALLEFGANPNLEMTAKKFANLRSCSKRLHNSGLFKETMARLLHKNKVRSFPLHLAIKEKKIKFVELLVSCGASLFLENDQGFNALGIAAFSNSAPDQNIVKCLIKNGADINAIQGKEGNQMTPLQFACQKGDFETIKFLLEMGGDLNKKVPCVISDNFKKEIYKTLITPFQKLVFKFLESKGEANKFYMNIINFLIEENVLTTESIIGVFAGVWFWFSINGIENFKIVEHPDSGDFKVLSIKESSILPLLTLITSVEPDFSSLNKRATDQLKNNDTINAIYTFFELLLFTLIRKGKTEKEEKSIKIFQSATLHYLGRCFKKLGKNSTAEYFFNMAKQCNTSIKPSKLGEEDRVFSNSR